MTLVLPRLKDREGDLWLLADHFLHTFAQAYRKDINGFSPPARELLLRYDYPGNVRELENIVARAVALAEGNQIQVEDLPAFLTGGEDVPQGPLKSLDDLEREHISRVLHAVQGRRDQAAAILGITRSTLWRKIKKFGLEFPA
jgi:two-component system response regulator AtoC